MGNKSHEDVYFDERGVLVTNARFVAAGRTFAMRHVTSTRFVVIPPNKRLALRWLYFGGHVAIGGLLLIWGIFGTFTIGDRLAMLAVALALLGGGLGFSVRAYKMSLKLRPLYVVVVSTSGGEVQALRDNDERFVRRVIEAINRVLIARG